MEVEVWDTYVKRENGKIMNFDILVPTGVNDEQTIFDFGNDYLKTKPFKTKPIASKECRICHIENATDEMIASITKKGYHILELKNCN